MIARRGGKVTRFYKGISLETVDCIIIGAGVAGLAIGRAAAEAGFETLVLERGKAPGRGVSSRNSGVIHAGIYYPANSLKTRLCLRGNALMYDFCRDNGVPFSQTGKWIVATSDEELPRLEALQAHGTAIGLRGLELEGKAGVQADEPALSAVAGLWSSTSGVVDVNALITALVGRLETAGGALVLGSPVTRIVPQVGGPLVTAGEDEPYSLKTRFLINAAGLSAQAVAACVEGLETRYIPPRYLSKGTYFSYRGKRPVRRLIYPLPEPGGLGVHATFDMVGALRFGPDVAATDRLDYQPDPARKDHFLKSIRRYLPDIDGDRLEPDYVGIRPKIVPADQTADFCISGPATHGIGGLVNLFGYESPGLTASLALAQWLIAGLTKPEQGSNS